MVRAKIEKKNTLFGRARSNIHIYLYFLSSLFGARILTYLRWLLGFSHYVSCILCTVSSEYFLS